MDVKTAKKKLDIQKAETAKMELEFKILKLKEEIGRIEEHIKLQDEIINRVREDLNG